MSKLTIVVACLLSVARMTQAADVKVSEAGTHAIILAPDGTVWCQGNNKGGPCLPGSTDETITKPTQITGLPPIIDIASNVGLALALSTDGRIWAWGTSLNGMFTGSTAGVAFRQTKPVAIGPDRVKGIAACSGDAVAALRDDGSVWMWGNNDAGILGNGESAGPSGYQSQPARVMNLVDITVIACGTSHVLALRKDGTVWAWGENVGGSLGLGDTQPRAVPTQVAGLSGVTRIVAREHSSYARLSDGTWMVWGGEVGLRYVPRGVPPDSPKARGRNLQAMGVKPDNVAVSVLLPEPLKGIVRDAVSVDLGVALLRDGTVRTWGDNSFGEVGSAGGPDVVALAEQPFTPKELANIIGVWKEGRGFALRADGTLFMWGLAMDGRPNGARHWVPTPIMTIKLGTQ